MITLTPTAAEQVRKSAEETQAQQLSLRLAAKEKEDGSFEYGLGFDEAGENDMTFETQGVEVLIAPEHGPLLKGATVDFVELKPGEWAFIFLNPNDPNYRPPVENNGN